MIVIIQIINKINNINNTNNTNKVNIFKKYNKKGGEAIASGGYGCIFKPPIKCIDPSLALKQTSDMVNKLMPENKARKEMSEIYKVRNILNKIPNSNKYFVIQDIFECKPDRLNANDLINFNKCKTSLPYTKSNINKNIHELTVINMPYGGKDISDFWNKIINNNVSEFKRGIELDIDVRNNFYNMNIALIDLLQNAIIPLNKLNFYHGDIKENNVLYREINTNVIELKIIDWGLSVFNKDANTVPDGFKNRAYQYNGPFSLPIFSKTALNIINDGIKLNKDIKYITSSLLHSIISQGSHYPYMSNILNKYYKNKTIYYNAVINNIITNYIENILKKYIINNKFEYDKYFSEVFSVNMDVWGFISIYFDFIVLCLNKNISIETHPILKKISDIIDKYCFSGKYAAEPIPINELINDLQDVNKILNYNVNISKQNSKKVTSKKATDKNDNDNIISIPQGKKRCPRGYRINKNTKKCHKIKINKTIGKKLDSTKKSSQSKKYNSSIKKIKIKKSKHPKTNKTTKTKKIISKNKNIVSLPKGKKRCPNGYRINKIDKKCHKIN